MITNWCAGVGGRDLQLCVVLSETHRLGLYKKRKQVRESKSASSTPTGSLLQLVPPDPCRGFPLMDCNSEPNKPFPPPSHLRSAMGKTIRTISSSLTLEHSGTHGRHSINTHWHKAMIYA